MKLYLDTSTPETVLRLNDKEYKYLFANDLAEKLLKFIKDKFVSCNKFNDEKIFINLTRLIYKLLFISFFVKLFCKFLK